ncbi:DUF6234 family protein [Kitasatospora sp. DSM 101779]|uniref:DUF6234 family protein n=1 Tax=Kitasatospora sp. DSM 101779 TaxID=2853165 RepID=UPI0021D9470C|nr:DUF6234 family protein [Kitasatospora sp. DSM 101779]MCU7826881.1 hypothetical protein [Kitasatospora sp. DSM 101779]
MTTTPSVPTAPQRLPWAGDLLAALAGLVLTAVVLGWALLAAGMEGWAAQYDGETASTGAEAVVVGVTAFVAGTVAYGLRRKAPITAVTQGLVALLAALLTAALVSPTTPDRQPAPRPTPTEQVQPYGHGPCRSGGTDDECKYSGG